MKPHLTVIPQLVLQLFWYTRIGEKKKMAEPGRAYE